jgi:hypothetical protein
LLHFVKKRWFGRIRETEARNDRTKERFAQVDLGIASSDANRNRAADALGIRPLAGASG